MKVASIKQKITPDCGVLLAGYGPHDVSVAVHDDLFVTGVCLDDGANRALILSFDLLGLDACFVQELRRRCAAAAGCDEEAVMLSCTHTHGGPHTRSTRTVPADVSCVLRVMDLTEQAVRGMSPFRECDVYFYSGKSDMNINRRVTLGWNVCEQLSDRRYLEPLADGFCDRELGMLLFYDRETRELRHCIVNYAAHPLASHTRGKSGHSVTADYPGVFRKMMEAESGAPCTFVTGAAGDQFPVDSETGFEALPRMAYLLLKEAVKGLTDTVRNKAVFQIPDPELRWCIERFDVRLRPETAADHPLYAGKTRVPCEIQLLGFGDTVCLTGVPGEMLAEVGQEIKWHSPFRKAFICYNSTGYLSYLCHGNALIAGSYEAGMQLIAQRESLELVRHAVDGMYRLLGRENEL